MTSAEHADLETRIAALESRVVARLDALEDRVVRLSGDVQEVLAILRETSAKLDAALGDGGE